jgi:hypothetical protein
MSAVGTTADQPAVIWRRQPISPTGGREVAVMAACGSLEEEDRADRIQGQSCRPAAAVTSLRPSTATTMSSGAERKASFSAVARAARLSSSFQCQLSTDVVDFRAPTPRPGASPPPPAHQSESPMFQWKLSSPPPRRASPIPSGYIIQRPVSPSLRQSNHFNWDLFSYKLKT